MIKPTDTLRIFNYSTAKTYKHYLKDIEYLQKRLENGNTVIEFNLGNYLVKLTKHNN